MLPKTDCPRDCPLFGDGWGMVPDVIVPGAQVVCVAQAPGQNEERGERIVGWQDRHAITEACEPQPLIGPTGWVWERDLLPHSGLTRADVSVMNVLKCRQQIGRKRVNDLPTGQVLKASVEHCMSRHFMLPSDARLAVAMGSLALQTLTGKGISVTDWRGFLAA